MTATNDLKMTVAQFEQLPIDERLGLLASIYGEVSGSIPAVQKPQVSEIVAEIEKISQQEQIDALRDLLPANKNDQDEVILDPHPSKALGELVQGKNKVPTGEYGALDTESKLAFWAQIAQKLGSSIVSIPSDYTPSAQATQLLSSLKGMGNEQIVAFLSQIFSQPAKEPPENFAA